MHEFLMAMLQLQLCLANPTMPLESVTTAFGARATCAAFREAQGDAPVV
jgi:hypothetical protein